VLQKALFGKNGVAASRQRSMAIIALYLLLIAGAELTTNFDKRYGIVFHACILFALLIHAAVILTTDRAFAGLLSALVVAPLIRILSISMPLTRFNFVLWFQLVSIPVFITIFTLIYLQGVNPRDIALNLPKLKYVPLEFVAIAIAVPFGIMEYHILKPGILVPFSIEALIVPAVILLVCTGFLEELAFRGLMQYHAMRTLGFTGIVLISVLFGVLHVGNLSALDVLLASSVGFIYSLVVLATNSIYGVSISHGVINIILFLIGPAYF
jgi:membrane protease YdiL (CAAX protease family)